MKTFLPLLLLVLIDLGISRADIRPTSALTLTGQLKPHKTNTFVETRQGYFNQEAEEHLNAMLRCARDPACSGLDKPLPINVCSRFRSHKNQRSKWLKRMTKFGWIRNPSLRVERVARYLAVPGSSRHHWGTDVDISPLLVTCQLGNRFFMTEKENVARCDREQAECVSFGRARLSDLCDRETGAIDAKYDAKLERAFTRCEKAEECQALQLRLDDRRRKETNDALSVCKKRISKMERMCEKGRRGCPTAAGVGVELYRWLERNAINYHFCQPYKGEPQQRHVGRYTKGYNEERWHWSYCCQAEPNRQALLEARYRPSVEDIFGNPKKWRKQSSEVMAAYRNFVQRDLPQYIGNTHSSCKACEARCPKKGVREAKR